MNSKCSLVLKKTTFLISFGVLRGLCGLFLLALAALATLAALEYFCVLTKMKKTQNQAV